MSQWLVTMHLSFPPDPNPDPEFGLAFKEPVRVERGLVFESEGLARAFARGFLCGFNRKALEASVEVISIDDSRRRAARTGH